MPVIERIPAPLWCCHCHAARLPVVRLATHTVDGTSVCTRHLTSAIEYAREKRQR